MGIKVNVGGKYKLTKREFTPAVAGNRTEGLGGGNATKREFKGSGVREYKYSRVINGVEITRTFMAHSVKEANRIASSAGFKTTDREIKRRNNNKKKRKK